MMASAGSDPADSAARSGGTRYGDGFPIVNEFGAAYVRKVYTRNGERLEISSPRLGYSIRLDALQLETLSWQEADLFSDFLETPFGPESHV